ncbi:MAG: hypothetical protein KGL95_15430 [Patescibacteria group bacterium]|nr:hypothetical protein [Patescibacteria group bacterium]
MKKQVILLFLLSLLFVQPVYADSPYVLPYPSSMPGTIFYKIHRVWEELEKYWYFGNFGQFQYNLMESDKYLVQARTLFEYKQYLLATQALVQSDNFFIKTQPFLNKAKSVGENITEKEILLHQAAQKHIEVLTDLLSIVPKVFVWIPEKSAASTLHIDNQIQTSISLRKSL